MNTRWVPHLAVALAATTSLTLMAGAAGDEQIAWAGPDGEVTTPAANDLMATPPPSTTPEPGAPDDGAPAGGPGGPAAVCDLASASRVTSITLDEDGVGAGCIVVGAGDLVTWVNQMADPVTVQAGDNQFSAADLSAAFGSFEVPAEGTATVRLIHAGRVDYASSDDPAVAGTILVLGRGSR